MEVEQQHDKGGDSKETERELRKFWNAKTCVELGLLKARGLVSLKANENTCFLKLYKTFHILLEPFLKNHGPLNLSS